MFFGNSVQNTRQLFLQSWQKYRQKKPLLPLEQQLVAVIVDHPEYHLLLEDEHCLDNRYFPETGQTNPFLHLGLHLALREQLATNRPPGVIDIYEKLMTNYQEVLKVEHIMIDCLAECLWYAQCNQITPNERDYLAKLEQLLHC
jgi:hypothetical protein